MYSKYFSIVRSQVVRSSDHCLTIANDLYRVTERTTEKEVQCSVKPVKDVVSFQGIAMSAMDLGEFICKKTVSVVAFAVGLGDIR